MENHAYTDHENDIQRVSESTVVSFAAVFWMSRNAPSKETRAVIGKMILAGFLRFMWGRLWLAKKGKGMWCGLKQPFLWGRRCVARPSKVAIISNQPRTKESFRVSSLIEEEEAELSQFSSCDSQMPTNGWMLCFFFAAIQGNSFSCLSSCKGFRYLYQYKTLTPLQSTLYYYCLNIWLTQSLNLLHNNCLHCQPFYLSQRQLKIFITLFFSLLFAVVKTPYIWSNLRYFSLQARNFTVSVCLMSTFSIPKI